MGTADDLISAAERLILLEGLGGFSGNQVRTEAGQKNASVIQYHFGGLDGLLHAVLDKHLSDVNSTRERMLDDLEAKEVTIRGLAEALILPLAQKVDDPDGGAAFLVLRAQMIHQASAEPAVRLRHGAARLMRLLKACPDATARSTSKDDLALTITFHALARLAALTGKRTISRAGREQYLEALIGAIASVWESDDRR